MKKYLVYLNKDAKLSQANLCKVISVVTSVVTVGAITIMNDYHSNALRDPKLSVIDNIESKDMRLAVLWTQEKCPIDFIEINKDYFKALSEYRGTTILRSTDIGDNSKENKMLALGILPSADIEQMRRNIFLIDHPNTDMKEKILFSSTLFKFR